MDRQRLVSLLEKTWTFSWFHAYPIDKKSQASEIYYFLAIIFHLRESTTTLVWWRSFSKLAYSMRSRSQNTCTLYHIKREHYALMLWDQISSHLLHACGSVILRFGRVFMNSGSYNQCGTCNLYWGSFYPCGFRVNPGKIVRNSLIVKKAWIQENLWGMRQGK